MPFAQEFVGLIQRRRICGSDPVDVDRVVDHTAVNTVAPHHAARQFIHGPVRYPRQRHRPGARRVIRTGARLAFDAWAEESRCARRRQNVCQDRAWALRVQVNGFVMAAWVGDEVIRGVRGRGCAPS